MLDLSLCHLLCGFSVNVEILFATIQACSRACGRSASSPPPDSATCDSYYCLGWRRDAVLPADR